MRRSEGRAGAGRSEIKVAEFVRGIVTRRVVGMAAMLWIAAGAFAQQRPILSVQTEARMIQMAGEAVARRNEKKKQEGAKPTSTDQPSDRTRSRRPVVRPVVRIVVSIPDRGLALIENDCVVKIYPVAVGAPATPSPEGEFRIATRLENPSWYWPGKVIPAGAGNPLGPRWMGLGVRGFGIHGTNEPRTIGRSASHGCIRMRNRDVKDLFHRVRVGDVVEIRAERSEMLTMIFGAPQDGAVTRATLRTAPARNAGETKFAAAESGVAGASRTVRE